MAALSLCRSRLALPRACFVASTLACGIASAAPGDTEAVSVRTGSEVWVASSALDLGRAVSTDGRYVVFTSGIDSLAPGGGNGWSDVYLRDRVLGTTVRVSVDATGREGDGDSGGGSISGDGRFIAYATRARNLLPAGTSTESGLLVHDRVTGATTSVDNDPDGNAFSGGAVQPAISVDGRFVAFTAYESMDPDGLYPPAQVYLHDRTTGETELVSVAMRGGPGNDQSEMPQVSADGRYVAFTSVASDLVGGDTNAVDDVFLRDRVAHTTVRMSRSVAGYQGNRLSSYPQITPDGRYVTFTSLADNLVPDDRNFASDIFVRDRLAGTLERVSVNAQGIEANAGSWYSSISDDGRHVAFSSQAFNLDTADLDYFYDVFAKDRQTGQVERANLAPDGQRFMGDWYPSLSSISGDGKFVAFDSYANTTIGSISQVYVFIHELGVPALPVQPYTLTPSAHDFGAQTILTSRTRTFWLQNTGEGPLSIETISVRGAWAAFYTPRSQCGASLAPGASCRIDVVSRPTRTVTADVELVVAAGTTPIRRRAITGRGVIAQFELDATALDFGTVKAGAATKTRAVTVRNTGQDVLPLKSIFLDGEAANQYSIRHDCGTRVAHGATCSVQVTFRPTRTGPALARLTVWGGGYAGARRVSLAGAGS
jgi:Tol biopolymer transport system component